MNIKTSFFSAAAVCAALAAVPATSEAKGGPAAALDACVKSFVATYLPDRPVREVTKDTSSPGPLSLFWAPREYSVLLTARGAKSGELIAEARCVANRQGIVVVLDTPILARDRARADFVVSLR